MDKMDSAVREKMLKQAKSGLAKLENQTFHRLERPEMERAQTNGKHPSGIGLGS